jgi:hypothetical protein
MAGTPDPRDSVEIGGVPIAGHADPGTPPRAGDAPPPADASPGGRDKPYLRLWFECSKQYARAYRSPDGSAYLGRCPTCGETIRFCVGPGGSSERFFRVSC